MAQSPSHTWGQIVGNAVELGVDPILAEIAAQFDLYLDSIGDRPARSGRKVTWVDKHGNKHDLDYVFERGGTPEQIGTPVGFVEVAWRRYTKHSKNKAQEIQGAVEPLVDTYRDHAPFMGAIIAGEFTQGALDQLASVGFHILYFPYNQVVEAFDLVGIDAGFGEDTPTANFAAKIDAWNALEPMTQAEVAARLVQLCADEVEVFRAALHETIGRSVERVVVLPLFGAAHEFGSVDDAVAFISGGLVDVQSADSFVRLEVQIRYTNGDEVSGSFQNAAAAEDFLRAVTSG